MDCPVCHGLGYVIRQEVRVEPLQPCRGGPKIEPHFVGPLRLSCGRCEGSGQVWASDARAEPEASGEASSLVNEANDR